MIANHINLLGIAARWQFFEAGHGKDTCDGIRAFVKRMADGAVKREKQIIQDAHGFYSWANSCSECAIKFVFVTTEECVRTDSEIRSQKLKAVKGTMNIHSVFPVDENRVATKTSSCFYDGCFVAGKFRQSCPGWEEPIVRFQDEIETPSVDNQESREDDVRNGIELDGDSLYQVEIDVEVGDHVTAIYCDDNQQQKSWFVGQVKDIDESDDDSIHFVHVNDKCKRKNNFYMTQPADEIWIKRSGVLCKVEEPKATGRSRIIFVIESVAEIEEQLKKRK